MIPSGNYWFPAKRYGWGWGWPITWQGRLVFTVFFALVVLGVLLFPPHKMPGLYIVYIVVLSAILVVSAG